MGIASLAGALIPSSVVVLDRVGGWINVAGHPNPTPIRNIHGQIVRANMENGGGKNIEAKAYTYT